MNITVNRRRRGAHTLFSVRAVKYCFDVDSRVVFERIAEMKGTALGKRLCWDLELSAGSDCYVRISGWVPVAIVSEVLAYLLTVDAIIEEIPK